MGEFAYAYPVYISLALSSIVIGYGLYRGKLLDVAPTASWALVMQAPFLLQSGFYFSGSVLTQAYGISILGIMMALGDWCSINQKEISKKIEINFSHIFLVVFLIALVFLPSYHLYKIDSIPLLDRLLKNLSDREVAESRNLFTKDLDVNFLFKYAFQWIFCIIGPLTFSILILQRKYFLAFSISFWIIIYSILSTARLPLFLYIGFSLAGVVNILPKYIIRLISVLAISIFIVFFYISVCRALELTNWYKANKINSPSLIEYNQKKVSKDPLRQLTLNDLERVGDGIRSIGSNGETINFLVYRIFLSPVDVSNHWYTYYEFVANERRSLIDPIKRNEDKASNIVGRWAYYERFPENYLPSINAYSSVDADAYSFGGLIYVAIVGFLCLLIRLYSIWVRSKPGGLIFSPLITTYLAIFLFQASFQAILIAQGLWLLLTISIFNVIYGCKFKHEKHTNT